MANDLNKVVLIGRITRDPELKQTPNGASVCRFSIANNRNYTMQGERREEVSFFNCVAWSKQGEIIHQYARKGKQVALDGRLQQKSWVGQDGKKNSSVEVVVENFQLLGSMQDSKNRNEDIPPDDFETGASSQEGNEPYQKNVSGNRGKSSYTKNNIDDDFVPPPADDDDEDIF